MPDDLLGQRLIAAARLATWETRIARAAHDLLSARQERVLSDLRASLRPPIVGWTVVSLTRKAQRKMLRIFAWADRPAAWLLMIGGFATFVAVLFDLIATGDVKWVTLLVAADLTVSGFSAVQEAENEKDGEDEELFRSYEAAMEALRRGELPGFTTEEEFLRYAGSRTKPNR